MTDDEVVRLYRRGDLCTARVVSNGRMCLKPRVESRYREAPWPLCPDHQRQFDKWVEREAANLAESWADEAEARAKAEKAARLASSVVYFISRGSDGLIKIGFTTKLTARMAALRREHGDLRLLASEPGHRDREADLHERFADHRVVGEWFQPHPALDRYITSLTAKEAA